MLRRAAVAIALLGMEGYLFAADVTIEIQRQSFGSDCIMGNLIVNGRQLGYTLELPWKDNAQKTSSIPPGQYKGKARYDHADAWRIQLSGVEQRSAVQIHIGNVPKDSEGCILVGGAANAKSCGVADSAKVYELMRNAFYGNANACQVNNRTDVCDQKEVTVVVSGSARP